MEACGRGMHDVRPACEYLAAHVVMHLELEWRTPVYKLEFC